jgi:transposase
MRYELTDHEWAAIKPMLPNKPRGVARVNDRRVLNGIFWVLRSGAPWRDLPDSFGLYTTCYNRFVRWRRAAWCLHHSEQKTINGPVTRRINEQDSRRRRYQRTSGAACAYGRRGAPTIDLQAGFYLA